MTKLCTFLEHVQLNHPLRVPGPYASLQLLIAGTDRLVPPSPLLGGETVFRNRPPQSDNDYEDGSETGA